MSLSNSGSFLFRDSYKVYYERKNGSESLKALKRVLIGNEAKIERLNFSSILYWILLIMSPREISAYVLSCTFIFFREIFLQYYETN